MCARASMRTDFFCSAYDRAHDISLIARMPEVYATDCLRKCFRQVQIGNNRYCPNHNFMIVKR